MEIVKLSLADLNAAWNFVILDLKDLENEAQKKRNNP